MKILIDARPLQTYSRYRGIGRYVDQIIEIFKEDPDFHFLFFKGNDIDERPVNRIIINTPRRGITYTDKIVLPRIIKNHRFDIFHATAFALPFPVESIIYILTIYDLTPVLFPQFSSNKNLYIFKKILQSAKFADRIIAISECTKNDLIRMRSIQSDRISVLYPPVGSNVQNEFSIKETPSNFPSEYVFYAGGFDGNKNVKTLVKALNIFQKPLVITGLISSKQKSELNDLLADKNRQLIFYTGYVPDPELTRLYRNAKLFAFPSLYEGFGYPPLEALANRTPSVISSSGSLKEVMKDAALYIHDPLDEKELAEKINLLWNDTALKNQIVNKSDIILNEYSASRFRNMLTEIYSSLFSGSE